MKKDKDDFRTHIPEPRWQQIASVAIVILGIAVYIWIIVKH